MATPTDTQPFDLFFSHASEDKPAVRDFKKRLVRAQLRVWMDEEQLAPGFAPKDAIVRGLDQSRHILVWVTEHWLRKPWTEWDLELFDGVLSQERRVIAVLHVDLDKRRLGPYLSRWVVIRQDVTNAERFWLALCGIRGEAPGERERWAERGVELAPELLEDLVRNTQRHLLRSRLQEGLDEEVADAYRTELRALDSEEEAAAAFEAGRGPRPAGYRVRLDAVRAPEEADTRFREAVQELLELIDYQVKPLQVLGAGAPSSLLAAKEGNFGWEERVFHSVRGLVTEEVVTALAAGTRRMTSRSCHIVTNTYVSPAARESAGMYRIELHTYEDLLDRVLSIRPYLSQWIEEYQAKDPLHHGYVEVKYLRRGMGPFSTGRATPGEFLLSESNGGERFEAKGELSDFIDAWVTAEGGGQVCLLGDYGAGKTSFLRHYFHKAAREYLAAPSKRRIPLLVSLNRYNKSTGIEQMMTDYLVNECRYRGNFNTFLKLAERGKLLVILDGFDEMARQVDVTIRRHNFREIARLLVGQNKVLLSGRPNYFLTKAEIDEILGQREQAVDPYARAYHEARRWPRYQLVEVALFDQWQIKDFLKKQSDWLATVGVANWRDLDRTIRRTYNLEELARTPVLLEIITRTLPKITGNVSELNAAKLYELYTGFWLDREYEKGDFRLLVHRADKELFVVDLAWHMLTSSNHEVHYSELSERVRRHFRLERATEIDYFSSDIRSCTYLVHSETQNTYKFIHKSFMEYFAAVRIRNALFVERAPGLIASSQHLPEEVLFFLCQMVDVEQAAMLRSLTVDAKQEDVLGFMVMLSTELLIRAARMELARGRLEESAKWVGVLLDYLSWFDHRIARMRATLLDADVHLRSGRYEQALERYHKVTVEAEAMEARQWSAEGRMGEGQAALQLGRLEEALSCFSGALELFADPRDASRARLEAGVAARTMGRLKESAEWLSRCIQAFEGLNDRVGLARATREYAATQMALGSVTGAFELSERSLALSVESGDEEGEWLSLMQSGAFLQSVGNLADAREIYERSAASAVERGDSAGEIQALSALAHVLLLMSDIQRAGGTLERAMQVARRMDQPHLVATTLETLAHHRISSGNAQEAISLLREALGLFEHLGDLKSTAGVHMTLGRLHEESSHWTEALVAYQQARSLFEALRVTSEVARTDHVAGRVLYRMGDLVGAERAWDRAVAVQEKLGLYSDLMWTYLDQAAARADAGALEGAQAYYARVLAESESRGFHHFVREALVGLGRVREATGDMAGARAIYERAAEVEKLLGIPLSSDVEAGLRRTGSQTARHFLAGPVIGVERGFFGREEELRKLERFAEQGIHTLILGDRRMGKTSLLYTLRQRVKGPMVPVSIDMAAVASNTATATLNYMLRQISHELMARGLRLESAEIAHGSEFPKALKALLDDARSLQPGLRLLLLLDELELVLSRDSVLAPLLRWSINEVAPSLVTVIAAAGWGIREESSDSRSPLFNIFTPLVLAPWQVAETRRFALQAFQEARVILGPAALERFVWMSGGFPYYAQLLGQLLLEDAFDRGMGRIDEEDVERVSRRMESPYLDYFTRTLSDDELSALASLAKHGMTVKIPGVVRQNLIRRYLLREVDGQLHFTSGLLEIWCREVLAQD